MPFQFHVPINLKKAYAQRYFEAELDLEVENSQGSFVRLDRTLFDTGAGFTSIPLGRGQQRPFLDHALSASDRLYSGELSRATFIQFVPLLS